MTRALGERHNQGVDSLGSEPVSVTLSPVEDSVLPQTLEKAVCCAAFDTWHSGLLCRTVSLRGPERDVLWHLQLPHFWYLWVDGKAGQGSCITADVSQRKTSSSTQNISLIRTAFTCQLVSLSCNTGQLLRRFPYLSFCSEIVKASGWLRNRCPEFLPPFLLWRKDQGQCHFKGRCGEVAPAPVCLLLSISAGSQDHFLM